jgi:hypothetical protein
MAVERIADREPMAVERTADREPMAAEADRAGSTPARPQRRRRRSLPLIARLWREWIAPHWPKIIGILMAVGAVAAASAVYPLLINWAFVALAVKCVWAFSTLPWSVVAATTL